jgi:hypothetical protein
MTEIVRVVWEDGLEAEGPKAEMDELIDSYHAAAVRSITPLPSSPKKSKTTWLLVMAYAKGVGNVVVEEFDNEDEAWAAQDAAEKEKFSWDYSEFLVVRWDR